MVEMVALVVAKAAASEWQKMIKKMIKTIRNRSVRTARVRRSTPITNAFMTVKKKKAKDKI